MFNIGLGLKKDVRRNRVVKPQDQMIGQVKKVLEQKGQGLILMVRG